MPKFSIIIPVKAINDYVRETVPAIQQLAHTSWELLIVPNELEANEWHDNRITILSSGKVGPAIKRDLAARAANGQILVFLDDDSYPKADLLTIAAQYFADNTISAIGGPGVTPPSDGFWQQVSGAVFLSRFTGGYPERYLPIGRPKLVDDWPSVNFMIRREIFLQLGGFDCPYWPGEDTKFNLKLKQHGYKCMYVPELVVFHHRRAGLRAHLKQIGGYGLHRGYFAKHYPENSRRLNYFIPSALVIYLLLLALGVWLVPKFKPYMLLGLDAYFVALCIGFWQTRRFTTLKVALSAMLYVPLTHIYYGLRFMQGFFQRHELQSTLR